MLALSALGSTTAVIGRVSATPTERWSTQRAWAWHRRHPWLVGCNFIPSTAINQIEMWQAETFDPITIDRELGWAAGLGFTSIRVFLHDLVWKADPRGFLRRVDRFLAIANKHRIGTMLVLFDGVWDPFPKLGPQRAPRHGVHNSGWVQSPGVDVLKDPDGHDQLAPYVTSVVRRFAEDPRVIAWDLFNEPDNRNDISYERHEPTNKAELAAALLRQTFSWARAAGPRQPLTVGVWQGDLNSPLDRYILETSDVISFHVYGNLDKTRQRVRALEKFGRPLLCTEFLARGAGSTFNPLLGFFARTKIGAYAWGLVAGKTQTIHGWQTWKRPDADEPTVWHHDLLRADGTPYDPREIAYIRRTISAPRSAAVR